MSTATSETTNVVQPHRIRIAEGNQAWLVTHWFDLLFVANLLWPLAILFCFDSIGWMPKTGLTFFQLYFLSSPHRWITLALVFGDRERFWKEPVRFGGLGLGLIVLGIVLVLIGRSMTSITEPLLLLMMVDFAWNAWHFAAQHAGISRIYGRVIKLPTTDKEADFEKMAIRLLVLWAFFRLAIRVGATEMSQQLGVRMEILTALDGWVGYIDPFAMIPAGILLFREIQGFTKVRIGRIAYIASVMVLYIGQLVALHTRLIPLISGFLIASAIFHATEYLAVVGWSDKRQVKSVGWTRMLRVSLAVPTFMVAIGILNYALMTGSAETWATVTLLVSLLHYAYDGMIWKSKPKPKSAPAST